jgi:tetratricopeptide (TPR) repeat protein
LGPNHPSVATYLSNLAELYLYQGEYMEAERLYKQALAIDEKALPPNHPNVATTLNNLVALYYRQGKYAEAEPLLKRALAIDEKALGPDDPKVATFTEHLALTYVSLAAMPRPRSMRTRRPEFAPRTPSNPETSESMKQKPVTRKKLIDL